MPSRHLSRRAFLEVTGVSLGLTSLAGCASVPTFSSPSKSEPEFRAGWQFQSEDPILRHTGLGTDGSESMLVAKVIRSEREEEWINWEYLEEIGPQFVDHFTEVAFDDGEFLVAVEVLLPRTHTIDNSNSTFEDGVLHLEYEVVQSGKTFDGVMPSNSLEKWATDGTPPEDVSVEVRYETRS